jgi:hypothetical protein
VLVRVGPWLLAVASGIAAGGGAPAVAEAAEPAVPVSLAWNAPAGCPSGDAVLADVNAILGGPTSHHAVARADVTQIAPQHWSVHVTTDVDGAQGERTLEADSCESLAKATALILAWTVDPIKARAAAALAAKPAPPAPAPEQPTPALPPPSSSSPIPVAAVVAVSGVGDTGTLQSLAGGAELALGALVGPLRFELSGDYWGRQDASTTAPNGVVGARLQLLDAALRACFRWHLDARFELDPCAGGAFAYASSKGYSDANLASFQSQTNHADWGVVRGDLLAAWRLAGPFALRASVGAFVQPTTPSFYVQIGQTGTQLPLHQPSEVAGRATLGVEAYFP